MGGCDQMRPVPAPLHAQSLGLEGLVSPNSSLWADRCHLLWQIIASTVVIIVES